MTGQIFQQVKRKLNITWDDADTDARVLDIMDSVTPYLTHKLGVAAEFDFSAPGAERDLFLSCCLYEWNHIPRDEWEENYKRTIADVRARHEVENYLREQEAAANGKA